MFTLTPYDLSLKGVTFSPAQDSLEWDGITYVKGQAFLRVWRNWQSKCVRAIVGTVIAVFCWTVI
jgi:hypothetical protein